MDCVTHGTRRCALLLGAAVLLALCGCAAAGKFTVDGRRVTVETDRFKVVFDGLSITQVENHLTGEVYAEPQQQAAGPSPALQKLLNAQGVSIESLRPAVPVKYFGVTGRTQVTAKRRRGGATVTYTGLQHGTGEGAEFDEDLTVSLCLSVDAETGDLLISPEVKGNIEQVHGVRDRGVLRVAVQLRGLADKLRVIVPAGDGAAFTRDSVPQQWTDQYPAQWAWPQHWEAALVIAEGERGCLGIWADEPDLRYGRCLSLCRSNDRWHAAVEFETADVIYRCDDIKNATWRLNVFKGYWVNAARRYQEQVKAQWPDKKPLAETTPAWAAKVRIVLGNHTASPQSVAEYAKLVPRDTMVNFTSQGWLKGWNTGEIFQRKHGDYFPNWPLDYPTHYEGVDGFAEQVKALEDLGVHVLPYTNSVIIDWDHPWMKEKIGDRHFPAWRIWQRFYPELCLDLVKRYPVSGIYEDCSWVVARHMGGEPDGENWYNGSVRMRQYFRQLMPQIAVMGERNNEVTARGQHFALGWVTGDDPYAHPICSFLFEPFVLRWNLGTNSTTYDAEDIRGFILTGWPSGFRADLMQEELMIRKRGIVFAQEQLRSYWPETWEANALHYWKGKDGTEYRSMRDRGTRFVRLTPSGQETIYWRLRGVREAEAPGVGIEGWVGYDGNRIVGLNPYAPLYVTLEGVKRPPAVIMAVPDGCSISYGVVRDGFWTAHLDTIERLAKGIAKPDAPMEKLEGQTVVSVRVRSDKPLQFLGVESVKKTSEQEYEVQVKAPGAFCACWKVPAALEAGALLGKLSAECTVQRRSVGVIQERGGSVDANAVSPRVGEPTAHDEGTVDWLVTLPRQPVRLVFQYGTEHGYGDGANYMVRVNGRTIWKKYRQQVSSDPEEAKAHKAPPLEAGAVDLTDYVGQTIVLELVNNGHYTGMSETIRWSQPRLEAIEGPRPAP